VRTEAVEARVIVRPVRAVGTVMHDESRLTDFAMPLMNAFLRRKKSAATVGRIVLGQLGRSDQLLSPRALRRGVLASTP
jgi:hypothetical protein